MNAQRKSKAVHDRDRIIIRLPDGLRNRLSIVAKSTDRTMTAVAVSLIQSGLDSWLSDMGHGPSIKAYDKQVAIALSEIIEKATEARGALAARQLLES